ncbi:MAG: hypothetical protein OEZ59_06865 [Deltaproteobacteria bacterium]|nr:hypothetical protein [Deltaproteobacteria bacterium]
MRQKPAPEDIHQGHQDPAGSMAGRKVRRDWLNRIPDYTLVKREHPEGEWEDEDWEDDLDSDEEPDPMLSIPDDVEQDRADREQRRKRSLQNPELAQRAFSLEGHYLRGLATQFARMISKVAEDSADLPSQGDEEWDMAELARRRFTGRHIHQCRMKRERRSVAVVLDTSPSCSQQSRLFATLAMIAESLGDCELFEAPNFHISSRRVDGHWVDLERTKARKQPDYHWNFKGRVVIAFGDFDGLEVIAQASQEPGNKIYWFSCEERPMVLESMRDRFIRSYKGRYLPALNLKQMMKAMKRVR